MTSALCFLILLLFDDIRVDLVDVRLIKLHLHTVVQIVYHLLLVVVKVLLIWLPFVSIDELSLL